MGPLEPKWARVGPAVGPLGPAWARPWHALVRPIRAHGAALGPTPRVAHPCWRPRETQAAEDEDNPDAEDKVPRGLRRNGLPGRCVVDRSGDVFIISSPRSLEDEIARVLTDRHEVCAERNIGGWTILDKDAQAPSHMDGWQGGTNREGRSRQRMSDRRQQVRTQPSRTRNSDFSGRMWTGVPWFRV